MSKVNSSDDDDAQVNALAERFLDLAALNRRLLAEGLGQATEAASDEDEAAS